MKATVILFKPSGKYYTEEAWTVPEGAIGPYDMRNSSDFRRIDGGAVLVVTQEPWGFPHLIPTTALEVWRRVGVYGKADVMARREVTRRLVDRAHGIIEEACATAEDQESGNDREGAILTLSQAMVDLDALLKGDTGRMAKTVIIMRNGNSLQVLTSTNTAADIAGLMNAGTPLVYTAVDVNDQLTHNIRVSEIQDVYQVP